MSLTDTLTRNSALMDELLISIHEYVRDAGIVDNPLLAHGEDKEAMHALVLAWVQRVEAEAAAEARKRGNPGQETTNEPQYDL